MWLMIRLKSLPDLNISSPDVRDEPNKDQKTS
jgi:hypothetical protein